MTWSAHLTVLSNEQTEDGWALSASATKDQRTGPGDGAPALYSNTEGVIDEVVVVFRSPTSSGLNPGDAIYASGHFTAAPVPVDVTGAPVTPGQAVSTPEVPNANPATATDHVPVDPATAPATADNSPAVTPEPTASPADADPDVPYTPDANPKLEDVPPPVEPAPQA